MRPRQPRCVPEPSDRVDILDVIEHETDTDFHADLRRACVLHEFVDPFETVVH